MTRSGAEIEQLSSKIARHVNRRRLLEIASALISVPSPTGNAGAAANALAEILKKEGFEVDRPEADHATSPAVVARLSSGKPGRTIQFNGHLDTVHLPFVPFGDDGKQITGSGASDMKGGLAAAVEALLSARDAGVLEAGGILLTAHDLHEAPWGFGKQFDRLLSDGIVGDAVLIPEPLSGHLPIAGRGQAWWKLAIRREGLPVHEVMRPQQESPGNPRRGGADRSPSSPRRATRGTGGSRCGPVERVHRPDPFWRDLQSRSNHVFAGRNSTLGSRPGPTPG